MVHDPYNVSIRSLQVVVLMFPARIRRAPEIDWMHFLFGFVSGLCVYFLVIQ